jgi:hypothetical protein
MYCKSGRYHECPSWRKEEYPCMMVGRRESMNNAISGK